MTSGGGWGDALAIAIQRSRTQGQVDGDQPLIRIDAQRDAAQAPFQFDPVRGRFHRRDCQAIPPDARSALFGRWAMDSQDERLACPDCCPRPQRAMAESERIRTVELLYGVASLLGQFGTLLRERGKEFRHSDEGRQLEQQIDGFYAQLDSQQRQMFELLFTSLEQLVKAVQECDRNLQTVNGTGRRSQSESTRQATEQENRTAPAASASSRGKRRKQSVGTPAKQRGRVSPRSRS